MFRSVLELLNQLLSKPLLQFAHPCLSMASQSSAEATVALKKSLQWINDEVDRLGLCWCAVSTEKGFNGTSHRNAGMWKTITQKYHTAPLPPTPRDKNGKECLPRNEQSLISKWKRTRPMIAKYMKYELLAISNPQSGENAEGVTARAHDTYLKRELSEFEHHTTYLLIKDEPKWKLDVKQTEETMNRQTNAAQDSVRERIERAKAKEPTVAGTKKPEGIKKARKTMVEISAKEKEVAREQAALTSYLDGIAQKGQLGVNVVAGGLKRIRVMQEELDDKLMDRDTSGMDEITKGYFELRKKHAMERLLAVEVEMEKERVAARLPRPQPTVTPTGTSTATHTPTATPTPRPTPTPTPTPTDPDRVIFEVVDSDEDSDDEEGFNGSEEEFAARVRDEE